MKDRPAKDINREKYHLLSIIFVSITRKKTVHIYIAICGINYVVQTGCRDVFFLASLWRGCLSHFEYDDQVFRNRPNNGFSCQFKLVFNTHSEQ